MFSIGGIRTYDGQCEFIATKTVFLTVTIQFLIFVFRYVCNCINLGLAPGMRVLPKWDLKTSLNPRNERFFPAKPTSHYPTRNRDLGSDLGSTEKSYYVSYFVEVQNVERQNVEIQVVGMKM
jgi:hypothetical protein